MTAREVLNELAVEINANAHSKGFWDGSYEVGTKIALIHSELSEFLERHRSLEPKQADDHCPGFENLEIELADAAIRIFDLAVELDLDIGGAIDAKVKFNATRPRKHGKRY